MITNDTNFLKRVYQWYKNPNARTQQQLYEYATKKGFQKNFPGLERNIIRKRAQVPGANTAAKKIQRAVIRKFGIKNNSNFLRQINKPGAEAKLERYATKRGYGLNVGHLGYNIIRKRIRVPGANVAARKIQKAVIKKFGIKNNKNFLEKMKQWEVTNNMLLENKLNRYAKNKRENKWTLRNALTQIKTNKEFLKLMNKANAARGYVNASDMNRLYRYAGNRGYDNAYNLQYEILAHKTRKNPKALEAAKKIQVAFKKRLATKNLKTNEEYLKKFMSRKTPSVLLSRYVAKHYPGENHNDMLTTMYMKRNALDPFGRRKAIKTIQTKYRTYINKRMNIIGDYISDLDKDGRFGFNVKVLQKLFTRINDVLFEIKKHWGEDPLGKITNFIGPCHIKPDEIPRKYLAQMFNQMRYVAIEYSKLRDKKAYRDRLSDALGDRPCLENLLDGMAKTLVEPAFEWRGKRIDPLLPNNSRYLSDVMGPAVSSWHSTLSNNNKKLIANKNLNARKQLVWNMVKSQNLAVMTNNGPVYSTPKNYNVNGKRFKGSNVANTLEYF